MAQGLNQAGVPVTGGLAGDGTRFGKTWVMANAPARSGRIAALGFYGDIKVKSGCLAGMSVLVVDDNASNRKLAQEILHNWGMKATAVESGEQALLDLNVRYKMANLIS